MFIGVVDSCVLDHVDVLWRPPGCYVRDDGLEEYWPLSCESDEEWRRLRKVIVSVQVRSGDIVSRDRRRFPGGSREERKGVDRPGRQRFFDWYVSGRRVCCRWSPVAKVRVVDNGRLEGRRALASVLRVCEEDEGNDAECDKGGGQASTKVQIGQRWKHHRVARMLSIER